MSRCNKIRIVFHLQLPKKKNSTHIQFDMLSTLKKTLRKPKGCYLHLKRH